MNRNDRRIALAALIVGALALVGIFLTGGADDASQSGDSGKYNRTGKYSRTNNHGRTGETNQSSPYYAVGESPKAERFPFDPNTADSTQLLRLGLQPWQVRNIYKYRSKGGIYRKKEDFARLYGLTVKQYRELEPYIRISNDYLPASTLVGGKERAEREHYERDTVRFPVKIQENEHIVLNTADTSQLKKVPGIGSYYAKEIVRHGQWLGGYVSVDQLDEIEDFPKDAKKFFVIQNAHPKKLNVNKLSLTQLRRHPYINYYMAKAITDYRRLHGPLTSLDDLRLSNDFSPEVIERLKPYIEF